MPITDRSVLTASFTTGLRGICSVLALTACLIGSGAHAADRGPRHRAAGQYDTVTATYVVAEGDALDAISARFEVPVEALEARNKLGSNELKIGQKLAMAAPGSTTAASGKKPNILFIMGDDIGIMNVSAYHRGIMVEETPNIDRIGQEGALFQTYYVEQSCPAGRSAFFTGMHPLRAGMIMPQLPGATSSLLPGTPALAKFLRDLGYNTGEFGKNHLGDKTASLPTAHGFQEFWGYLYHLDAMQGVSFPDINKSPTDQSVVPPCKNTPVPGLSDPTGRGRPEDHAVHDAAAAHHRLHLLGRHREEPDVQG